MSHESFSFIKHSLCLYVCLSVQLQIVAPELKSRVIGYYPRDLLYSAVSAVVHAVSVRLSVCHTPALCLNG